MVINFFKLYDPFLWMGFNCLKATEPLRGSSLLFTTKFPEVIVLIWLTSEGWKAESVLDPPSGFEHQTSELEIQCLDHLDIALRPHGVYGFPKLLRFIYFLSKISFIELSFLFPNKILNLILNSFVIFFINGKNIKVNTNKKTKKL